MMTICDCCRYIYEDDDEWDSFYCPECKTKIEGESK